MKAKRWGVGFTHKWVWANSQFVFNADGCPWWKSARFLQQKAILDILKISSLVNSNTVVQKDHITRYFVGRWGVGWLSTLDFFCATTCIMSSLPLHSISVKKSVFWPKTKKHNFKTKTMSARNAWNNKTNNKNNKQQTRQIRITECKPRTTTITKKQ